MSQPESAAPSDHPTPRIDASRAASPSAKEVPGFVFGQTGTGLQELIVVKGADEGKRFELTESAITLGRSPANHICLHDSVVSRRHAELRKADPGYQIVDLGSTDGTFVNGQKIQQSALKDGDQIALGHTVLAYSAGRLDTTIAGDPNRFAEPRTSERATAPRTPEKTSEGTVVIRGLLENRIRQAELHNSPVARSLQRAMQLVYSDPDMGLAKCRQILETTLTDLYTQSVGNPGTRRLEQLITDLVRQGKLPRKVHALCEVVRELGNVGVHPIYDDEELSHREALIALQALVIVLEWYSTTTPKVDDGKPS